MTDRFQVLLSDEPLEEFWAVTQTSVYHVSMKTREHDWPTVKKVACKGGSEVGVGGCLKHGHFVGISKIGIILYEEDFKWWSGRPRDESGCPRPQRLEEVNTRFWGGSTSPVSGLFFTEVDARGCLDGTLSEEETKQHTLRVLEVIGEYHPVFTIARSPGLALEL